MSTRSAIARVHGDGFRGTYHHWDGYPEGLGKTLWQLYHGHFKRDLPQMLRVLIDEHPAGWSTINDKDFSLAPGFVDHRAEENGDTRPLCYCHGERHEEARPVTQDDDRGMEWAYVFTEGADALAVLERIRPGGGHAVGMFGTLGVHRETGERQDAWRVAWAGSLDGPEPDWDGLDGCN